MNVRTYPQEILISVIFFQERSDWSVGFLVMSDNMRKHPYDIRRVFIGAEEPRMLGMP